MGYYQTEQIQDDGSVITFQHDKPNLTESQYIWKKSLDSFAVSSDYGHTWRGFDSNANAVLNILAVEGIVADWIRAGKITDKNSLFSVNLDKGFITMKLEDNNLLKIWTKGITMYSPTDEILTSMFNSNNGRGVLTANHLYVGSRGTEKIELYENNGNGIIKSDIVQAGSADTTESKTINLKAFEGEITTLKTDVLVIGGQGFSPRTITVDGQQITVLAR